MGASWLDPLSSCRSPVAHKKTSSPLGRSRFVVPPKFRPEGPSARYGRLAYIAFPDNGGSGRPSLLTLGAFGWPLTDPFGRVPPPASHHRRLSLGFRRRTRSGHRVCALKLEVV